MFDGLKLIICKETLQVPLFIFCFLKLLLPIRTSAYWTWMYIFMYPVLTAILLVLAIMYLIGCAIYFELINLCAKFKFGDKYYQHLHGADAVWAYDERPSKSIVNAVYHIEYNTTPEQLKQATIEIVTSRILRLHSRLNCKLIRFLGYYFFIYTQVNANELVNYLPSYKNNEEFEKVLNDKFTTPLPKGTYLWEVCVGQTELSDESGNYYLPLIYRFHHSLADGVSLITLLITASAKNGVRIMKQICNEYKMMFNQQKSCVSLLKTETLSPINKLRNFLNEGFYFNYDFVHYREKQNILHQETINKVVTATNINETDIDLIVKIKRVKEKLKVSYNDVFLGALSAALTEHYAKYEHIMEMPSEILTGNPYFLRGANFNELVEVTEDNEVITKLGNKFTVAYLRLPINKNYLNNPVEFVWALNKETISCKKSMDFQLIVWMFNNVATIVPAPLAFPLTNLFDSTAIVSNLCRMPPLSHANGSRIIDMSLWSHHYLNVGTTVTSCTYQNKLRLSIMIDQMFVHEPEHAREIIRCFARNVKKIYESLM